MSVERKDFEGVISADGIGSFVGDLEVECKLY